MSKNLLQNNQEKKSYPEQDEQNSNFTTCTKAIDFEAAHLLHNHEGKCRFLHGHHYVVKATFIQTYCQYKKKNDMIIDFGIIKQKLGNWIAENWDHNIILSKKNMSLGKSIQEHTKQKVFFMPGDMEPTAENMSSFLIKDVCPMLFNKDEIKCIKILLYETPTSYAETSIL